MSEKVGVNQGFVGCVEKLTAGHMDMATIYNLEYPSSSTQILDGLDVGKWIWRNFAYIYKYVIKWNFRNLWYHNIIIMWNKNSLHKLF